MALNWDARNVRDWHELHNTAPNGEEPKFEKGSPEDLEGDKQWVITESLIFRFMAVDMGSLTEKNIDEFYERNNIVSRIIGKPFRIWDEETQRSKEQDFTYEDLQRRIGLSCNVITETRSKFKKRWWDYLEREAKASLRYTKPKEEAKA